MASTAGHSLTGSYGNNFVKTFPENAASFDDH